MYTDSQITQKTQNEIDDFLLQKKISEDDLINFYFSMARMPNNEECMLIKSFGVNALLKINKPFEVSLIGLDYSFRPKKEQPKPFNYDWLIEEKQYLNSLPVNSVVISLLRINKQRADNLLSRLGYK